MNDDVLYSIADISRHFSLPESTCRYYCKRFHMYIPSVGEGRRRRYRPETIDVITTILDEMKKSRTASAVDDVLAARFPRNTLSVEPNSSLSTEENALSLPALPPRALELMERQTLALEGIAKLLTNVLNLIPQLMQLSENENPSLAELRQEISNLRVLVDSSEKTQQADLEQLRSWMGRLVRTSGKTAEC